MNTHLSPILGTKQMEMGLSKKPQQCPNQQEVKYLAWWPEARGAPRCGRHTALPQTPDPGATLGLLSLVALPCFFPPSLRLWTLYLGLEAQGPSREGTFWGNYGALFPGRTWPDPFPALDALPLASRLILTHVMQAQKATLQHRLSTYCMSEHPHLEGPRGMELG